MVLEYHSHKYHWLQRMTALCRSIFILSILGVIKHPTNQTKESTGQWEVEQQCGQLGLQCDSWQIILPLCFSSMPGLFGPQVLQGKDSVLWCVCTVSKPILSWSLRLLLKYKYLTGPLQLFSVQQRGVWIFLVYRSCSYFYEFFLKWDGWICRY